MQAVAREIMWSERMKVIAPGEQKIILPQLNTLGLGERNCAM